MAKANVRKLYLSSTDKKWAGVCGGIAEYFEIDSTLVRLGWVVGSIATGIFPGLLAYFLAVLIIPKK